MKQDIETVLEQVKQVCIAKLNDKLASIEAEKADSIELPRIDDNAYALQELNDAVMNYDPFIAYGIEEIGSITNRQRGAERLGMYVIIVLSDLGRTENLRIMYRYSRALKEIFEENWQNYNISNTIEVTRSTVVPFQLLDSSATYKAVGINLETVLS